MNFRQAVKQPLILDGAMATELEKRGVDTNSNLWSARALLTDPNAVYAVHYSYFAAGADIAITNTYQANVPAFEKIGLTAAASKALIAKAVQVAQQARTDYLAASDNARDLYVAGSVGPYGAYLADGSEYTGAYQLDRKAYQVFHYPRIAQLVASGVDVLAIETQPNFAEIQAVVALLQEEFPQQAAWVSLSIKDAQTLCDGTPLAEVVTYLNQQPQVVVLGVNCTALTNVTAVLQTLQPLTDKPLLVYPNSGEEYDPSDKTWHMQKDTPQFSELVPKWQATGAQLIGGCCRTTPGDIEQISQILR